MTVLITGGTGLVGSRLLRRLVDCGITCRALVRNDKQFPPGVTAVKGDILDPASLVKAVEGVSAIVHLAAVLRTPDPDQIWSVNRDGTRNLIAAVKQYAADARFIMASTGLVYNMDGAKPGREDDEVAPTLPYPASKVAAEGALQNSGLNWSVLRFGFVYGDQDGHLETVPKLAAMFQWHPAMRLSMLHHADIMTFVKLALAGAADKRIVNLVDDAPMSIYEVAKLVGMPIESSAEPLPNPWWGQLDGSFARSLGFQPQVATVHHAMRDGML
ncbi:epimerase [Trinickia dabaoshanensis]|uniref:Epimerase n=1 Tax=Trinickia dabaoshanensis TaxID=564714 RepID=A0A2N7VE79_9BURK|nr:NAD(P)-dependent oxidoreductase [Trinickia dabaoshanensis]PMS15448.1 epimerase [Trinickia dabaoshanensis]